MEFVLTLCWQSALFWVATALWIAEFVVFPSRQYGDNERNPWSFLRIFMVVVGSFALSGLLYHFQAGNLSGAARDWVRSSGLIVYTAGAILRYWAAFSLGAWFSRHVEVRRDQRLVSRGPYRQLRHPLYLGLFLLSSGMHLMIGNLAGFVSGFVVIGWALNLRMAEEERLLESVIGTRYSTWKETRYRFVPFVF